MLHLGQIHSHSEVLSVLSQSTSRPKTARTPFWGYLRGVFLLSASFFIIELFAFLLLKPEIITGLCFGALWSMLLSCCFLLLPRKVARILYGVAYFTALLWALAQAGYYQVFDKMMWLSTVAYAGEGATF